MESFKNIIGLKTLKIHYNFKIILYNIQHIYLKSNKFVHCGCGRPLFRKLHKKVSISCHFPKNSLSLVTFYLLKNFYFLSNKVIHTGLTGSQPEKIKTKLSAWKSEIYQLISRLWLTIFTNNTWTLGSVLSL